MRVSIAMTTWNGAAWVDEQLESFAAQTRLPDELVVCDDFSEDATPERVAAFAARAPFTVRIERNTRNLTTTPNFGKAVSLCSGDAILLSDQDDVWHPEKLATLAGVLEAKPAVGVVFCNARVVDERRRPLGHTLWDALWFDAAERARVREGRALEVFARHVVAAGTTLAIRSTFRDLYLPFPDLHDCHDAWLSFLAASVSQVEIVDRELLDYRVHGANQFGLRKLGLREQLEKARWQLEAGIFDHNARFFTQVRERLLGSGRQTAPGVAELLDARIAHARARRDMPSALLRRVPVIAGEALRGNYRRFSYGLKSVAQDIWLR